MAMAAAIDRQAQAEQAELVLRLGRGDQAGLREIADLYARPMYQLAWRLLFDAGEARDVVSAAFARLWAEASHWRQGDGRIGGWLYGVSTGLCLNRLRQHGVTNPDAPLDGAAACLAALPPRQRAAIVLTRCEALPNVDVADILGVKLAAFESLLSDARLDLQARLRTKGLRVDQLNHYLEDVRPPTLPAEFAASVVAEAIRRAPGARRTAQRDRRGAWLRRHRTLASIIAANIFVVSGVAAMLAGQGMTAFSGLAFTTPKLEQASSASDRPRTKATGPQPTVSVSLPLPALPAPIETATRPDNAAPVAATVAPSTIARSAVEKAPASRSPKAVAAARDARPRLASLRSVAPTRKTDQRAPRAPISLLPAGFHNPVVPSHPRLAQAVPPAQKSRRSAADFPDAEPSADSRGEVLEYLLSLSPGELRKLRAEYRTLARERRDTRPTKSDSLSGR